MLWALIRNHVAPLTDSLEAPQQGASNMYHQYISFVENKKNFNIFLFGKKKMP